MNVRIMKLRKEIPSCLSIKKSSKSCYEWKFTLPGPKGSPWEDFLLSGKLLFPASYPDGSISIVMEPPLFHPNIDPSDGLVCDLNMKKEGIDKVKSRKFN